LSLQQALAFKAYEIEELADVCFFRPLGAVIAYAARAIGLTPTQLTVAAMAIGAAGGALLHDDRLAFDGFLLLVLGSIFDSSDGQLARLTGRSSDFGRLLDGVAGYVTYAAVYVSVIRVAIERGSGGGIFVVAALAILSNIFQAQLYDHHRTSYTKVAIKGVPPKKDVTTPVPSWAASILRRYHELQRMMIGPHGEVEARIAAASRQGIVSDEIRARYRAAYYWPVRGWNLMGENNRIYAIGVLAWIHHVEWFLFFGLVPMNLACAALWLWQRGVDRRFLESAIPESGAGAVIG
jgi:hypothetical protein